GGLAARFSGGFSWHLARLQVQFLARAGPPPATTANGRAGARSLFSPPSRPHSPSERRAAPRRSREAVGSRSNRRGTVPAGVPSPGGLAAAPESHPPHMVAAARGGPASTTPRVVGSMPLCSSWTMAPPPSSRRRRSKSRVFPCSMLQATLLRPLYQKCLIRA